MERIYETDELSRDVLSDAIAEIWAELKRDSSARHAAKTAGAPIEALDLKSDQPPYRVDPITQGFDPVTQIAISVVAGVAVNYAKKVLDPLWELYVEPALYNQFGSRLKRQNKPRLNNTPKP